jgi:hypothetical protein
MRSGWQIVARAAQIVENDLASGPGARGWRMLKPGSLGGRDAI